MTNKRLGRRATSVFLPKRITAFRTLVPALESRRLVDKLTLASIKRRKSIIKNKILNILFGISCHAGGDPFKIHETEIMEGDDESSARLFQVQMKLKTAHLTHHCVTNEFLDPFKTNYFPESCPPFRFHPRNLFVLMRTASELLERSVYRGRHDPYQVAAGLYLTS